MSSSSAAPIGREPQPMGAAGVVPPGRGSKHSPLAPLPKSCRDMLASSEEPPLQPPADFKTKQPTQRENTAVLIALNKDMVCVS
ncbi:hypothetical protein UY3_07815 [Chelonia mydas]|uniref:Uncharacterized protein n=1 Tax=Chelonia mydas TaxID=8469 RepID=M7C3I4_CHEMY|nr:hypothetical protein UY3_07815 [Chelonia mydas]